MKNINQFWQLILDKLQLNKWTFLATAWWLLTLGTLVVDSYFYPGLLNSVWFFSATLLLFLFFVYQQVKMPRWFLVANTLLVVVSGLFSFYLSLQEWQRFDNYIFSVWHLHYAHLSYIFFLSWIIVFLQGFSYWGNKIWKQLIFILPLLLIVSAVLMRLWPMNAFLEIVKEDRIVEQMQAWSWLGASIFSFMTAWRYRKEPLWGGLYVLLGLGLFFVAGEEIAWGQRIFGFETPDDWAEKNLQQETTLHNLPNLPIGLAYILLSIWGSLSWIWNWLQESVLKSWLEQLLAGKKNWEQVVEKASDLVVVPWWISLYFAPIGLYNIYQLYLGGQWKAWSEPTEWFLALGILLVFFDRWYRLKKHR